MNLEPIFKNAIEKVLEDNLLKSAKEYFEYIGCSMLKLYQEELRREGRIYGNPYITAKDNDEKTKLTKKNSKKLNKLYRELSLKYHPDRNPNGAEIFVEINKYHKLGDVNALENILLHGIQKINIDMIRISNTETVPLTVEGVSDLMMCPAYMSYLGKKTDL